MIQNAWNWVKLLGVNEQNDDENHMTILFNQVAFISILALSSYCAFIFSEQGMSLYFLITFNLHIPLAFILIFNGLNKIYLSRYCISIGMVIFACIYHIFSEDFLARVFLSVVLS